MFAEGRVEPKARSVHEQVSSTERKCGKDNWQDRDSCPWKVRGYSREGGSRLRACVNVLQMVVLVFGTSDQALVSVEATAQ